jgi:hypothetical protein
VGGERFVGELAEAAVVLVTAEVGRGDGKRLAQRVGVRGGEIGKGAHRARR